MLLPHWLAPPLRWLRRLCLAIGVCWLAVTLTPVTRWTARWLAGPWHDPQGDVLIVLGGSLLDQDLIGVNSYWRAVYASLAWREGGFRQVVISGGGPERTPIAVPMRQFLVCMGVPADAILVETKSQNTRENARYTRELLEERRLTEPPHGLVLLTSDYHMYRARRVFERAGLAVRPRPFPDVIKRSVCWHCRWDAFLDLVWEAAKIAYYRARGWI